MRFPALSICLAILAAGLTLYPTRNGAEDHPCDHPSSADVRALYEQWETTLRGGDVEALTALYSPGAILMGPGATSIRIGRTEIAAYYTGFVSHAPTARIIERVVRTECGAANDLGLEAMTFAPMAADQSIPARFSMSYVKSGSRWLIVHHHQEMLQTSTGDIALSESAPASITTGTNPTPASANPRLQFSLPLPRGPEPPPAIDRVALDRLLALASPHDVVVPRPAFALGHGTPTLEAVPAAARVLAMPIPRPVVVDVPRVPFALAAGPPMIADLVPEAREAEQAWQVTIDIPPGRRPEVFVHATPTVAPLKPTPKPAVAGFTQRLPSPAPPVIPSLQKAQPPVQAPAQARSTAVIKPAAPTPAARAGRFLRWDESVPVFDD